jgi:hypothetical protein
MTRDRRIASARRPRGSHRCKDVEPYAVHFQKFARRRVVVLGGLGEAAVHQADIAKTPMLTAAASAYGCVAAIVLASDTIKLRDRFLTFAALIVSLGVACTKSRTIQEILQRTLNVRGYR